MDPQRTSAQAIAIEGDSILAVGSDEDILAMVSDETTLIDLEGNTILPGFNDAHSHLLTGYDLIGIPSQEAAIQEALRLGYTSITEMFADEVRLSAFLALDQSGNLPLRVNGYLPLNYAHDRYGDWYTAYNPGHEYSPFLRIAGVKIFIDNGDYGEKYLTQPYADNPGYSGEVFWSQAELNALLTEVHRAGYQIAAHTGGDAALDLILNALEATLDGESNEAYHHRVEHVMIARDDQVQRMSELGILASVQLSFFHSDWGDEFESTLGSERAHWVGRWRDLLDAGVTVVGSTDAPYGYGEVRSPLKAISQSATRIGDGGSAPRGWMLDQRITVAEALDLMTLKGAYATFQDPVKGSLTPGKLADLIILSADPLAIEPEELLDTEVWLTMVGGETRYCAPGRGAFCP
jgi:predicted amidohydrolase YtcJ